MTHAFPTLRSSDLFPPGSDWSLGKGMKMSIGVPVLRPDGLYDVSHSYYCGTRCAAHVTSVMAKGPTGWTVHSSTLQSISLRRSEEHTSELQSLMRISYAVFCLKKKNNNYKL